jgi:hypothetical protein
LTRNGYFKRWQTPKMTVRAGHVYLILKRASTSRSSGERNDDDYD